jgi:hypothetical protein
MNFVVNIYTARDRAGVAKHYDVYIGRPSKWGNPFILGKDGTREEVIRKYEEWLQTKPELIEAAKVELKGKRLGCYCHPRPCHGHVLARIANE